MTSNNCPACDIVGIRLRLRIDGRLVRTTSCRNDKCRITLFDSVAVSPP